MHQSHYSRPQRVAESRGIVVLCIGLLSSISCFGREPTVQFARDIRPLLSENCFQCHGPDEKKREADLRLDVEESAKQSQDGRVAVVAGKLDESELWRRIVTDDEDARMPPADSGRRLTAPQIALIRRWIEEGAAWEKHWSFSLPRRPLLPASNSPLSARTPLDSFIFAKLETLGLKASAEADREALIRRVTFDLTGLPPSPDEIDAFLADSSPRAYETLVERLLASPRYGERMAWTWLDGARYADTSGYQNDGPRLMWRWRDWVIDAFNQNMPFDRFTIEQIAGDLLPNATRDQRLATGFNRNHRGNAEGGIIPEEYQVEYVVDRVDTTCTVWLGLTMGCARCHDHKYDPLTQKEFYRVFSYFNNIPEFGRAIKEGNSPPYMLAPTDEQEARLKTFDNRLADLERRWAAAQEELAASQAIWENSLETAQPRAGWPTRELVTDLNFDEAAQAKVTSVPAEAIETSEKTVSQANAPYRFIGTSARFEPGAMGAAIWLNSSELVEVPDAGNFGYFDKFSVSLWVKPEHAISGTLISRMTDEEQGDGWYLQLRDGHVQVNLVKRWLDDAIRVETAELIPAGQWSHLLCTYDGSRLARGITLYLNGKKISLEARLDLLNQTFSTKEPLRIGGGNGRHGRFAGAIDELRLYKRVLDPDEIAVLADAEPIPEILKSPRESRSPGQALKMAAYYLEAAAPSEIRALHQELIKLRDERRMFTESLPTVMVMEEMASPRDTFVLLRGEYNKHGEKVVPGVPGCLPPLASDIPNNRLGFAQWIVSRDNPLTARVFVNRIWQMHFGAGLVRITEDFGVQGEPPTHPELLDWLAVEFMDSGWDVKQLHRWIVTSAAYRQSAKASQQQLARDPDNRWLSRGPRFRLSAEMIRDQALAASGLLADQVGGPSVKPYQPTDLWKDLATDTMYEQDHGANLYRRSLYTYWKRTVAPPSMMTFDAAGREACQVRFSRTNTPLQALTLLNEVTYVEAARVMAERVMMQGGDSIEERLSFAFRLCTARRPNQAESKILAASLRAHLDRFQHDSAAAEKLLQQGEFPRDMRLDVAELAAYTAVGNLILNLDEVITRQ